MKARRGFTLIELMVVVLIVAVLAGLAISSYSKQVRKSRRAEAKQVITDYALREEKYRSTRTEYMNSINTLLGAAPPTYTYYTFAVATPAGNCDLTVVTAKTIKNSFTVTATAKADQVKDTACTPLVFENRCGVIYKTPAACW